MLQKPEYKTVSQFRFSKRELRQTVFKVIGPKIRIQSTNCRRGSLIFILERLVLVVKYV